MKTKILAIGDLDVGLTATLPPGTYYIGDPRYGPGAPEYSSFVSLDPVGMLSDPNGSVAVQAAVLEAVLANKPAPVLYDFHAETEFGHILWWYIPGHLHQFEFSAYEYSGGYTDIRMPAGGFLLTDSGTFVIMDVRHRLLQSGPRTGARVTSYSPGRITFEKPTTLTIDSCGNLGDWHANLSVRATRRLTSMRR